MAAGRSPSQPATMPSSSKCGKRQAARGLEVDDRGRNSAPCKRPVHGPGARGADPLSPGRPWSDLRARAPGSRGRRSGSPGRMASTSVGSAAASMAARSSVEGHVHDLGAPGLPQEASGSCMLPTSQSEGAPMRPRRRAFKRSRTVSDGPAPSRSSNPASAPFSRTIRPLRPCLLEAAEDLEGGGQGVLVRVGQQESRSLPTLERLQGQVFRAPRDDEQGVGRAGGEDLVRDLPGSEFLGDPCHGLVDLVPGVEAGGERQDPEHG